MSCRATCDSVAVIVVYYIYCLLTGYASVRFTNITVGLTNNITGQPVCVSFGANTGTALEQSGTFICSQALIGRYVTITKTTLKDFLIVCEVIVSGYPLYGKYMELNGVIHCLFTIA